MFMVVFILLKIIKHMICPNLSHIYVDMAQIKAEHIFRNSQKKTTINWYKYVLYQSPPEHFQLTKSIGTPFPRIVALFC